MYFYEAGVMFHQQEQFCWAGTGTSKFTFTLLHWMILNDVSEACFLFPFACYGVNRSALWSWEKEAVGGWMRHQPDMKSGPWESLLEVKCTSDSSIHPALNYFPVWLHSNMSFFWFCVMIWASRFVSSVSRTFDWSPNDARRSRRGYFSSNRLSESKNRRCCVAKEQTLVFARSTNTLAGWSFTQIFFLRIFRIMQNKINM